MSDLATTVASMGKWVQCPAETELKRQYAAVRRVAAQQGLVHPPECICHNTGKVWEYALSEPVRVACAVCEGTTIRNAALVPGIFDGRDCPNCHGLGWTASKDLAVWFKHAPRGYTPVLQPDGPGFRCDMRANDIAGTKMLFAAWADGVFLQGMEGEPDPLEALLMGYKWALETEGYTVHPDVEKVRMP